MDPNATNVHLITNEHPPRRFKYDGPIPRVGEKVELLLPARVAAIFVVSSVRYVTNGPIDSHYTRVIEVAVRGRLAVRALDGDD